MQNLELGGKKVEADPPVMLHINAVKVIQIKTQLFSKET